MAGTKGQRSQRNKQFWIDKGYSIEDALFESRKRLPGTFEYFRYFKNIDSDEEASALAMDFKLKKKNTKENFILRYGESEGIRRWDVYRDKQAKSNSFEYKRDKHGWTEEQFDEYNKTRAVTLDNLILRHGESIGIEIFERYKLRQSYAGCKLEYFIEKYGVEEGTNRYNIIGVQKSHSYKSYLLKYDNDVEMATHKFELYLQNRTLPTSCVSNIANELFDHLFSRLLALGYSQIYYANNIGEWSLYDTISKKPYFYDFFLKDNGKLIEFNGDYWHANPNKYKESDIINYPNDVQRTAKEVWEHDRIKLEVLTKYPIVNDWLIVWEYDYRKDKSLIIEQCLNFLTK